ncbi:MAG: SDR family NAD(P)-dependent oxidoreductase [Candidatus Nanopelagicales bacterium]
MPTYLITGATSGIGLATATMLAERGADLVLMGRNLDSLEKVQAELGQACVLVAGDVRETADVERAFAAVPGPLDGVVHAAAVAAYGRFEQIPPDVFTATVATTLLGTITVARAAITRFIAQGGGRLVVVGSLLGDISVPYMSPYITAKWGVHGLVRTLQQETRGSGIDISLVSPGGVDTPIYDNAATYLGVKGQAPGKVQSAQECATRVVSALHRPRRQVQSGPLNRIARVGYRLVPAVFDAAVGPVMRWQGLHPDPVAATPGNVFSPVSGEPRMQGQRMKNTLIVHREVNAPAKAVWQVLTDGWTYATWVVGASRVRDVDATWPATGSRIHHAFGPWPAVIQDYTRVERSEPERELVLKARGWPVGEARVVINLTPTGAKSCRLSIQEDAIAGPGTAMPRTLRQAVIGPRNKETLYRLALIAEGRYRNHDIA